MELRFEDAPSDAYEIMSRLIDKHFPELLGAKILILMDLKKRESQKMIVLARMVKTNDLQRHLTIEEAQVALGYDYIMFLDKLCWSFMEKEDKERLVRHELRHTDVNSESDKPFGIRGHTIEDFHSEVKLNQDDPRWNQRVAEKLMHEYDQLKEPQKQQQLDLS